MKGWVVTVLGEVGCFIPEWRGIYRAHRGTLFPTYEAARNAMRMSQRTDRREGVRLGAVSCIYRVEAP